MPSRLASAYSCSRVRPPLPRWERRPPRRPEEMSRTEILERCRASPDLARSLLTVRDAISLASDSLRPRSFSSVLMWSYCRSRFAFHDCCGIVGLLLLLFQRKPPRSPFDETPRVPGRMGKQFIPRAGRRLGRSASSGPDRVFPLNPGPRGPRHASHPPGRKEGSAPPGVEPFRPLLPLRRARTTPPSAPSRVHRSIRYPVRPMSTALKGLDHVLQLQELDLSVDRLRNRREALEAGQEVRAFRQQLEQAETRLGDVRLELDAVERASRRLEGDIDSLTRKAKAEEGRLYDGSVANPKELEAIQHEVASLRGRRSRLEDNLLELMEQKETL